MPLPERLQPAKVNRQKLKQLGKVRISGEILLG